MLTRESPMSMSKVGCYVTTLIFGGDGTPYPCGSLTSHGINCEELWDGTSGSSSSLSEKTRKCNHLQMPLQRKHFLLSYFKTLSVDAAEAWTRPPARWSGTLPIEPTGRRYFTTNNVWKILSYLLWKLCITFCSSRTGTPSTEYAYTFPDSAEISIVLMTMVFVGVSCSWRHRRSKKHYRYKNN